ncbi:MAG: hypothetical protein R3C15_18855 [Thermoleophilia bacterium]
MTVAASGANGSLTYAGQTDTLQDVEQLKLTGSSEGEDVNLDAWTLPATILGGGGSDRILLTRDVDMVGTSTINNVIGPENTSDTIAAAGGGEIALGSSTPSSPAVRARTGSTSPPTTVVRRSGAGVATTRSSRAPRPASAGS